MDGTHEKERRRGIKRRWDHLLPGTTPLDARPCVPVNGRRPLNKHLLIRQQRQHLNNVDGDGDNVRAIIAESGHDDVLIRMVLLWIYREYRVESYWQPQEVSQLDRA
ncbi:10202_t:CDS:1, partial [Acaulospora colombiana]